MKNVLVLTSTFPLSDNDTQPGFVASLCNEIVKKHRVHVLAPSIKGEVELKQKQSNIFVTRYRYFLAKFETLCGGDGMLENLKRNPWLHSLIPLMLLSQFFYALRICMREKIEVIHAHWIIPQGLVAAFLKLFLGRSVKLIVTSHGGDLYALNKWPTSVLKKWVLHRSDCVTVVSTAMKRHIVEFYGLNADRVHVIPMGVDLSATFTPGGDKKRNRLVFVGRLAEKKGVDVLLRAAEKLQRGGYSFSLDLIGGGFMIDEYRRLADELGVNQSVNFLGALPNCEVVPFLRNAGVAVFPFKVAESGDQEGLGLTMVEAMGCQCLTISTRLPAVEDVVKHGETGLLVQPDCANDLAETLAGVMQGGADWSTVTKKGREFVLAKFDWKVIGDKYSRVLASL